MGTTSRITADTNMILLKQLVKQVQSRCMCVICLSDNKGAQKNYPLGRPSIIMYIAQENIISIIIYLFYSFCCTCATCMTMLRIFRTGKVLKELRKKGERERETEREYMIMIQQ